MQQNRYHRQMLLPDVGEEGQAQLSRGHAMLIGCGALGCTVGDLLVRAGVGVLTVVDRDIVEITNLQRQSLFDETDVAEGLPKAIAAQRRLQRINSDVQVRPVVADFTGESALAIASGAPVDDGATRASPANLIIDGTDNFETRYLMNDLAVKLGIPYVYGGAVGTRGMQMTVRPGGAPCLRCLFEEAPSPGTAPTCDTAGIFAPVATIVAACEAADALQILIGRAQHVGGTLLDFDLWKGERRRLDISRMARPDCPCCARHQFEFLEGAQASGTTTLCGRSSVQVMPALRSDQGTGPGEAPSPRINLASIARQLAPHGAFNANRFLLRGEFTAERGDSGAPLGITLFPDGRAIVHGTTDPARARAIYARYVGS